MSEKKLKLNITRLRAIDTAMQGMDYYDKVITEGERERAVRVFYELGELRLDIARNRNRILVPIEAFQKAQDALVRECSNGAEVINPDHENWLKFKDAFEHMSKSEEEISLITIQRDKLKLDKNPFSILVLTALEDIIEG